ncbi:MAG: ABC transporter permease subunit, partial [Candidatus Cloacimonetes bacterium]|nr:ABC transporter permease subunit [Candidatus Cloacimonadota bacterium]
MFREMLIFELKYRLSKISTYVYMGIFFLISVLTVVVAAGAFTGMRVNVIGGGERILINSPFFIHSTILGFQLIAVFFCAAFSGDAVSRDHEYNMFQLIYSKPISKMSYLLGRFLGNAIVLTMIMLTIGLGILVASLLPWLDRSYFGKTDILAYLMPYATVVLPNMIISCGIFFAVGALTKKQVWVYITAILLLVVYLILSSFSQKISMKELVALLDPFAMGTSDFITSKMTPAQRNTELVPLEPVLIYNRLLWLGIGFAFFWLSFIKTTFAYPMSRSKAGKRERDNSRFKPITIDLKSIRKSFTPSQSLKQLYYLTKLEIKGITTRFYFWILVVVGLVLVGLTIKTTGQIYETETLPVTYQVLTGVKGGAATLLMIIITLFTGELLWMSRIHRMDLILDSTPAKSWVFLFSKYFAMLTVEMMIVLLSMLLAVGFQLISGFTNIKPDVYLVEFLSQLSTYARLTAIAFTVHTLVNNKYLSHFIFIGIVAISGFISLIGLEHPLFNYGSGIGRSYSDMAGWNGNLMKDIISTILWSSFVGLGLLFAYLYTVRGRNNNVKERHLLAQQRFTPGAKIIGGTLVVLYLATASIIFYDTNITNEYHLSKTWTKKSADHERTYKKYDGMPGPRVTDVSLKVDLYPEERRGVFGGTLVLKNKESVPLDSMYVEYNQHLELVQLDFSKPCRITLNDEDSGIRVYRFDEPLMPGESFESHFEFISKPKGFNSTMVVKNGTFLNNKQFVPSFAYNSEGEISSPDKRKKQGLPPKERMAKVDDEKARMNTYISNDSDWVNYEVVMSTIPSQTAISPGYVIKEWEENGRKYTHYKMDQPILNFVAFLSAELEVKKD